jgi:Tol biopolymer transport system component
MTETLSIARQIADALDVAHEKGIIHRDLKPANVKITPEGTVKVLDFGLAKVGIGDASGTDLTAAPTVTLGGTREGLIVGTAAYMSPEQARGQPVDKRTDIWAFGCVLYEMLTGRAAFVGPTITDTLAAILEREPNWQALPLATPGNIHRWLRRCLEKDPKRRWRDIGDARIELTDASASPTPAMPAEGRTPIEIGELRLYPDGHLKQSATRFRERLAWISALALVILIAAAWQVWFRQHGVAVAPALEMRLEIITPPTTDASSLAISPDGQKIVFAGTSDGRQRLWLRLLGSPSRQALTGTDSAYYPFWSPDSRSLGFFADGKLKRIDIETGSVQVLASATAGRGGAWNRDGVILFAPQAGPIYRISADGGERTQLTRPEQGTSHRFPEFLPDGRHFLYYVPGSSKVRGVHIGQLDGTETRRLVDADVAGVYLSSGKLMFIRQGTMLAQDFDPVRLALSGHPVPVAEQVAVNVEFGSAAVSASATGLLAYRAGPAERRQLTWFDRSGREVAKVGSPDSAGPWGPSISPDGGYIALTRTVEANGDIWLLETARGALRRLTLDPANDVGPIWSPDGSRIAFSSNREGPANLYEKPADGAGDEKLLLATPLDKQVADWSPDGRFLLYRSQDTKTKYDLWALPLERERKPFPIVQTNFDERDAQFSPDGKWIAYESDESGRFEIYVQPFPGPGAKLPISTNGGAQVRWPHEGKELFYIGLDERLMAVPIRLPSNGQAVEVGAPVPLFPARVGGAVSVYRQQYMVSPDGQRFLINTVLAESGTSRITLILNLKSN